MNEDQRIRQLERSYRYVLVEDPERYDLLDKMTIEATLKFVRSTRLTDARAAYLPRLQALIGDDHLDPWAREL